MMTVPPSLLLTIVDAPEPIGSVRIVSDGPVVLALDFGPAEVRLLPLLRARFGAEPQLCPADDPGGIATAVRAYFDGDVAALDKVAIDGGGTPFQRRIWEMLRSMKPGTTRSYGALAAALGQPGAARAVGLANGRNPISLIVPCHRVVGANGALTGYAGGIARKRWLLAHEQRACGMGADRLLL
jgi:methylated-DNA-[protein]-cysteine S-methyltransferase